MANYRKLQADVATGRFTFPVAIGLCVFLWIACARSMDEAATFAVHLLAACLLIELNTTFSLIRTRTSFHPAFYLLFCAACAFLHPFRWAVLGVPALMLACFGLLSTYESESPARGVFYAFFFLSAGSIVCPRLLWFAPLFAWGALFLRALSARSLLAMLFGLATPYWFLFGYSFWMDRFDLFAAPLTAAACLPVIGMLPDAAPAVAFVMLALTAIACSLPYVRIACQDRVRTRLCLTFLIVSEGWAILLTGLFPNEVDVLLPLLALTAAIPVTHLFALVRTRYSAVLFIVVASLLVALILFNLWTCFFSS